MSRSVEALNEWWKASEGDREKVDVLPGTEAYAFVVQAAAHLRSAPRQLSW